MNLKFLYENKIMSYYRPQLDSDSIYEGVLTDLFGGLHANMYNFKRYDSSGIMNKPGCSQPIKNVYLDLDEDTNSVQVLNANTEDIKGVSFKLSDIKSISGKTLLFATKDKYVTVENVYDDSNLIYFKITNTKLNKSSYIGPCKCNMNGKNISSLNKSETYYFDFENCKIYHTGDAANCTETKLETIQMPEDCFAIGAFGDYKALKCRIYEIIVYRQTLTSEEISNIGAFEKDNDIFSFDPCYVMTQQYENQQYSLYSFTDKVFHSFTCDNFSEMLKNSICNDTCLCNMTKYPNMYDSIISYVQGQIYKDDEAYGESGSSKLQHPDSLSKIEHSSLYNFYGFNEKTQCKDFEEKLLTDESVFRTYCVNDSRLELKSTSKNMVLQEDKSNINGCGYCINIENLSDDSSLFNLKFIGNKIKFYVKIHKDSHVCDIKGIVDKNPKLYITNITSKDIKSEGDYIIRELSFNIPSQTYKLHSLNLYFCTKNCKILYFKCNGILVNYDNEGTYKYIIVKNPKSHGETETIIASSSIINDCQNELNWSDQTKLYTEKEYTKDMEESKYLFNDGKMKYIYDEYIGDFIYKYGFDYNGTFLNSQSKNISGDCKIFVMSMYNSIFNRQRKYLKLMCNNFKNESYYDRLPDHFNILKITQDSLK